MNSFVIAFINCQFLNKFNSNFAHLFSVHCMNLHHSIYLHSSITRLWSYVDLVYDLDHVHNWPSLVMGQSSLNEPSPLQARYHGTDCLKILGHLHRFPFFARHSMNICLTSLSHNFGKAPSRMSYLIRALYKCSVCMVLHCIGSYCIALRIVFALQPVNTRRRAWVTADRPDPVPERVRAIQRTRGPTVSSKVAYDCSCIGRRSIIIRNCNYFSPTIVR